MVLFQHTATRRWLQCTGHWIAPSIKVSTHSHPKVAAPFGWRDVQTSDVSTHSHPKVAAYPHSRAIAQMWCFNTQPPEGGCVTGGDDNERDKDVSTHSHPKVAATAR